MRRCCSSLTSVLSRAKDSVVVSALILVAATAFLLLLILDGSFHQVYSHDNRRTAETTFIEPNAEISHRQEANSGQTAPFPCISPFCEIECAAPPRPLSEYDRLVDALPWPNSKTCGGIVLWPVMFGAYAQRIVQCVPLKIKTRSAIIPFKSKGYTFGPGDEYHYTRDLMYSYFGITRRKHGWDCSRHYEILSAGAVPYFINAQDLPEFTLPLIPKTWLVEVLQMPGVSGRYTRHRFWADSFVSQLPWKKPIDFYVSFTSLAFEFRVNPVQFNQTLYYDLAYRFLRLTQKRLTTKAIAQYMLKVTNKEKVKTALFLSERQGGDYLRDRMLHGFRELLGAGLVDVVKVKMLYYSYLQMSNHIATYNQKLYGNGFYYPWALPDLPSINRENISARIAAHEFDLIIYGSMYRGLPFYEEVRRAYAMSDVFLLYGEDLPHDKEPPHIRNIYGKFPGAHLFVREIPDRCSDIFL